MRFQIFSRNLLIGSSNLDWLDSPMGIASGDFLPSENYQSVQLVFRLYAEAGISMVDQDPEMLDRYYRERDNLSLTVRLPSGEDVPVQCIHIEDYSVELGEMIVTIATIPGTQTFSEYFEPNEGAAS